MQNPQKWLPEWTSKWIVLNDDCQLPHVSDPFNNSSAVFSSTSRNGYYRIWASQIQGRVLFHAWWIWQKVLCHFLPSKTTCQPTDILWRTANRILATGWSSCHRPHPQGHPVAALPGQVSVQLQDVRHEKLALAADEPAKGGELMMTSEAPMRVQQGLWKLATEDDLSIMLTYLNDVK